MAREGFGRAAPGGAVTAARIDELRRRVAGLEGAGARWRPCLPFGIVAIDDHLPGGGLRSGALHEVAEAGATSAFAGIAALFAAGVLARLPGAVLWCQRARDLFAPALAGAGLVPERVIFVEASSDAEVLAAMEEGLRHRGLGAAVGEVARLSLTASRRLHLAAEASGVTALVVRRWRDPNEAAAAMGEPTAALTRWRVSPLPGAGPPVGSPAFDGLARALWLVELTRAKGADAPRSWTLEAPDATGRLRLPAHLADRPVAAGERPPRAGVG